eukprot:scaffold10861_cov180-Amphora_coffeaeformis.AAC.19
MERWLKIGSAAFACRCCGWRIFAACHHHYSYLILCKPIKIVRGHYCRSTKDTTIDGANRPMLWPFEESMDSHRDKHFGKHKKPLPVSKLHTPSKLPTLRNNQTGLNNGAMARNSSASSSGM